MVIIGSDHRGFDLKNSLIDYFQKKDIMFKDIGVHNSEVSDYALIAFKVSRIVLDLCCFGVICCGSGIGVSIASNKVKGIRASLCTSVYHARMARAHNDANIICLGGRVTGSHEAIEIFKVFISTEFEKDRHQERIDRIKRFEENQSVDW
ncbi:MAG: ribose 5-phosphate isomerase B [Oscillospiraceae bacterium]|jgi:ribose 5-phosphate isomerase B|nr:ribose 5-phosphate isomerase B [Oscillospiraceae bacterium]